MCQKPCCCCAYTENAQLKKDLKQQKEESDRWEGLYKAEHDACNSWRTSANYHANKAKDEQTRRIKAVSALKTLITELKEQPNVD